MYLHKTPRIVQDWFPNFTWRRETQTKDLYVTFDDGPIPELTPWVLDQLEQFQARATFFVVGDNIENNQDIFQQILAGGHSVGNHTYNHLNGRRHSFDEYYDNVMKCQELLPSGSTLFRPPYGRMTSRQSRALLDSYEIIMWDVLSADFDQKLQPEKCLQKSIANSAPGSIIVFHDNVKASDRLKYALPRFLEHFASLDYTFKAL